MEWYLMVLKKYAEFNGRSRRREYWMFAFINAIIYCVLYGGGLAMATQRSSSGGVLMVLALIYALGTLVPGLAVGVRRLHDTNRSAWWLLISLIPLIGGVWLLVLLAMDGTPGDNQYGPNPKLTAPAALIG
jgi:uncharacterized membrane protein YhaH (DUF805 family)